ncbi:hypothetical protein, partial [Bacillus mycoides]|uniref:hypothetical protein n=1 Tax=Bacillus mycoides TaxID=1405 RepID=UPI0019D58014
HSRRNTILSRRQVFVSRLICGILSKYSALIVPQLLFRSNRYTRLFIIKFIVLYHAKDRNEKKSFLII